jgi:hypothetical protein
MSIRAATKKIRATPSKLRGRLVRAIGGPADGTKMSYYGRVRLVRTGVREIAPGSQVPVYGRYVHATIPRGNREGYEHVYQWGDA